MKKASLTTDGSCLDNPRGQGGRACMLRFDDLKGRSSDSNPDSTNNRMELMAPIQGLLAIQELLALQEPCPVEITSDSKYVVDGTIKWISGWKQRHWWRKHEHVPNADLWIELDALASPYEPTGYGSGATAITKTTSGAIGWHGMRQPLKKSSWADGRPHAALPLNLHADYVAPKPPAGLFDDARPDAVDDGDE